MGEDRLWLDVPFGEKDQAKAAGAWWDAQARRWYAPRPGMTALERWTPVPPLPEVLPGEDRALGSGLFVDLIPESCWFTNARSCLSERDWDRVRQMVTTRAGRRCEVCGVAEDRDARRWMEVHERWTYDDEAGVQGLGRLICLCTGCHTATHFGLANIKGLADAARAHLMKVTGMSELEVDRHIRAAFRVWQERSRVTWTLDLSLLTRAGLTPVRPPHAADRPGIARSRLGGPPSQ